MKGARPFEAWQAYFLGLGLTALTALVVVPLARLIGPLAALLFVLPGLGAAWYGGFWPGALATTAAAAALAFFVLPPIRLGMPPGTSLLQLIAFVSIMAVVTSLASRRRRAEHTAQRQATRWEALAHLTQALATSGPGTVAATAGEQLAACLAEPFVLQLLDPADDHLHTAFVFHAADDARNALREAFSAPEPIGEAGPAASAAAQALAARAAVWLPGADVEQLRAGIKPRYWPGLERFVGHSVLAVPLRSRNAALGVLRVLRAPGQPAYSPEDQAWVQALADRVGAGLDIARQAEAQRQAHEMAQAALRQTTRLQAVAAALAAARTAENVARVVVERVLPEVGAARGSLALLDESGSTLEVIALGTPQPGSLAGFQRQPLDARGPLAEAVRTAAPVWLPASKALPTGSPAPAADEPLAPGATAALPVLLEGRVLGGLAVWLSAPADLDPSAQDFLLAVAGQCAHAFQRIRAHWTEVSQRQAAEEAAARLARLQTAGAALAPSLDLDETLEAVAAQAMAVTGADLAGVSLLAEDGASLHLRRAIGYSDFAAQELAALPVDGQALEAGAWRSREPATLPARSALPTRHVPLARAYLSLRCEVLTAVPLPGPAGKPPLGVLTLGFGQARDLAQAERDTLAALAQQCAGAIWRARAFTVAQAEQQAAVAARQAAQHLEAATTELARSLEVAPTLEAIARLAVPGQADACLAYALDGGGAVTHTAAQAAGPEQAAHLEAVCAWLRGLPAESTRAQAGPLLMPEAPLLMPEVSESVLAVLAGEPRVRAALHQLDPRSLLSLPLRADGRRVGGLLLLASASRPRFAAPDQRRFAGLAERMARALSHALQHAGARSLNIELDERVRERTQALQATVAQLEAEIAQRREALSQLEQSGEQLRRLSARLQATREEERARIAHDVHEQLGQQLAGLKLDIAWLRRKLREQQEPLLQKTRDMADLIDSTVGVVRKITAELRPGILDELGLAAALEWQLHEFERQTGLDFRLSAPVEPIDLTPEATTAIFRVFQESLANVARHAGATRVDVTLATEHGHLELVVQDDGRGITEAELASARSLGLLGMRERIALIGGAIEIAGGPANGTTVTIRLALPAAPPPKPPSDEARPGPATLSGAADQPALPPHTNGGHAE